MAHFSKVNLRFKLLALDPGSGASLACMGNAAWAKERIDSPTFRPIVVFMAQAVALEQVGTSESLGADLPGFG